MFPADVARYQEAAEFAAKALTLPNEQARATVALALAWGLKTPPGGCGGLTYEKWRLEFLSDSPDTQLRRWAGKDYKAVGPELAELCGDVWAGPLPSGSYDPDAASFLDPLWSALETGAFWLKVGTIGALAIAGLLATGYLINATK